jgi:hypothetical protein
MRRAFVLRVVAEDPAHARALAEALVEPLAERGARVLHEGAEVGEGGEYTVQLSSGRASTPGVTLRIGVWDENAGARWLAPIQIPREPREAVHRAIGFLQTWGFVGARVRAHAAPRAP